MMERGGSVEVLKHLVVFSKYDKTIFKTHLSISLPFITAVVLITKDGPGLITTHAHIIDRNHIHLIFHGHKVLHDKLS